MIHDIQRAEKNMGNVECMYRILPGASRRNEQCEIIHAERGRGRTMEPDVMCTALYLDLDNISLLQTHSRDSSQI